MASIVASRQPEPMLFAEKLIFGEGLRWYRGRLYLSDMLGRKVYAFAMDGTRETVAHVPARPNGLGFLPDGRMLITSMADQKLLLLTDEGHLRTYADLSSLMTGYCGDMAVDAAGRVYLDDVGYRVFEGEERKPGRLLRIDPDGTASILLDGLAFPNGLWITPDGTRLIFAEGRAGTIHSFKLSPEGGELRDQAVFAKLPNPVLDGLTLDRDGGVWQCCPHDREILYLAPDGTLARRVAFPQQPVACCLGGPDLSTLFVVAADYTLERMAKDDTSAALYTLKVDVPGFFLPGDA